MPPEREKKSDSLRKRLFREGKLSKPDKVYVKKGWRLPSMGGEGKPFRTYLKKKVVLRSARAKGVPYDIVGGTSPFKSHRGGKKREKGGRGISTFLKREEKRFPFLFQKRKRARRLEKSTLQDQDRSQKRRMRKSIVWGEGGKREKLFYRGSIKREGDPHPLKPGGREKVLSIRGAIDGVL